MHIFPNGIRNSVKCKQPCPGLELASLCLFSTTINITTVTSPGYNYLLLYEILFLGKHSVDLLNDPHIYNRSLFSQKCTPYLLNDPRMYNRLLLSKKKKNPSYLLSDPHIHNRPLLNQKKLP